MNEKIATGHVMRCLSIADAAKGLGEDSVFICADTEPVLLISERGYDCRVLGTRWDHPDDELEKLERIISEESIKVILVDSYYVTGNYLNELEKRTRVFFIDDFGRDDYFISGVIRYGMQFQGLSSGSADSGRGKLYGSKYAPLRKEFVGSVRKHINKAIGKILLMSGGSDPYNVVGGVLRTLKGKDYLKRYSDIWAVCGQFSDRYSELADEFKEFRQVHILKGTSDIKGYMEKADVAVTAGGSTKYELCAVGTPAIVYTFADNQICSVRAVCDEGVMLYAGDAREESAISDRIVDLLTRDAEDFQWRQDSLEKMQRLVDGKGAERIAKKMIEMETSSC